MFEISQNAKWDEDPCCHERWRTMARYVARDEAQGCQVGWAMRIGSERGRERGKVGGEESRSAGGTRTGLPRGMVHEGGNRVATKDGASG